MQDGKLTQLLDIEIPSGIVVSCPKDGRFAPVGVANHCLACEHFLGMVEVDGPKAPFDARYRVQCACPLSRRLTAVSL